MMWTGVRSPAVASRTSWSKKGTSAPGCWKGFSAEPARYSSTLLCAAARTAVLTGGAAGRFFFFLAAVFFFAADADGEPASRQQPRRAAPSARGIRQRITLESSLRWPLLPPMKDRHQFESLSPQPIRNDVWRSEEHTSELQSPMYLV